MAESASTLELQQQRALNADTFARQNARQVDPNANAASQSERLQSQLDAAQVGTKEVERETIERYARQRYNIGERFSQLRKLRERAKGGQPQDVAAEAANRLYARYVNIFQSELIANVLALEIVVSPWVFLGLFFLRVLASVIPLRARGITIIPPYSLRGGGIGVFLGHLAAALIILAVLFALLFFIMYIVWVLSEDPITQTKFFIDMSGGVLGAIKALFSNIF